MKLTKIFFLLCLAAGVISSTVKRTVCLYASTWYSKTQLALFVFSRRTLTMVMITAIAVIMEHMATSTELDPKGQKVIEAIQDQQAQKDPLDQRYCTNQSTQL
jgi:hypothetical protein